MSTENQSNQPQQTFMHFEESGDKIKVSISGKGGDLINLMANAIDSNPDIRMVVELALQSVRRANGEESDGGSGFNPLMALMAAMAAQEGEDNDEE